MGNCLRRGAIPAKDGFPSGDHTRARRGSDSRSKVVNVEDQKERHCQGYHDSCRTSTEVKIRVTKKQLEELWGMVEVKELTVEQILSRLIDVGDRYEAQQRPWKPALQSIPEVN